MAVRMTLMEQVANSNSNMANLHSLQPNEDKMRFNGAEESKADQAMEFATKTNPIKQNSFDPYSPQQTEKQQHKLLLAS